MDLFEKHTKYINESVEFLRKYSQRYEKNELLFKDDGELKEFKIRMNKLEKILEDINYTINFSTVDFMHLHKIHNIYYKIYIIYLERKNYGEENVNIAHILLNFK